MDAIWRALSTEYKGISSKIVTIGKGCLFFSTSARQLNHILMIVHLNQNVQCESNKQTYLSATLAELTILLITSLDKLCSTSNRCASPNLAIRWKANAVNQKNKAN